MRLLLLALLFAYANESKEKYNDEIYKYRQHYKEEFITEQNSPLKAVDTGFLRFYAPDETYKVIAEVVFTEGAGTFKIPTHNPKVQKEYREYGVLKFKIKGKSLQLHAYQSTKWAESDELKNMLFIPFMDKTNDEETYGGGRYIDLSIADIRDGKITLDFNKCYNPYCAFGKGYSCPIPPRENSLDVSIKAGEKLFGKPIAE